MKKILEEYGTINYEEDGEIIKGITTKEGNYEIAINEIYNGKTTQEVRKLATQAITAQNYGDEVNYSANGVDSWKVFLNDGKNVYIIASDYVPRSGMNLVDGINEGDGYYCVSGNNKEVLVTWLQEVANWIGYVDKISGATATGGPTIEQFWSSYNEKYDTNYYEEVQDLSGKVSYNNILYFPHKEIWKECRGYWLATLPIGNTARTE